MERLHNSRIMEKIRRNSISETQIDYDYKIIDSPVGKITLMASELALVSLIWGENAKTSYTNNSKNSKNSILKTAEAQLKEYFAGKRKSFDIPLDPKGTDFQKQVWNELSKIPYGKTISYGEQAKRLGQPKAARAVGAANGKNPIGIIVPCHRVIGASGSLTGFAGGIAAKKLLLALEVTRIDVDSGKIFPPSTALVDESSSC